MANETILVVDGDTRSRKVLEVSFKKSGYRVSITKSIDEAFASLDRETPDLIVSDTDLPDGDGFEFCKRVKSRSEFEHIPFLFLTEEAALPRKIEGLEIGADDYLTRPIYIKEVTTRIEALLQKRDRELLSEGGVEEFTGELAEITLIDLLQTIDEEERTGRVDFERDERRGTLTFREGRIIDARCGKLQGEAAVYRLMLWPSGTFVVTYQDEVRGAPHIDRPTEDLLLEGIQRLQQWNALMENLPSLDRVFETDYRQLPELLDDVPEEVGRIVRLFDGFRTLREVIGDSPVDDVTSLRIVRRIFEEGVLQDITSEADRESAPHGRSHLADWLEQGETGLKEDSGFDEHEENTSPGYPGGGRDQNEDEIETDKLDHEDLANALADELEDGTDQVSEEFEELDEDTDSGTASGRRYQPAEKSDGDGGDLGRVEGADVEEPASVDETLDELEQAERLRRQEEAKRLVEQQQELPDDEIPEGDPERDLEAEELRRVEEQGVPRIPGATRTRDSASEEIEDDGLAETAKVDSAKTDRANRDDTSAPHPGEPASGEWETSGESTSERDTGEEPALRPRDDTPRARPTADSSVPDGGHEEQMSAEAEQADADASGSGVPVSFKTVDDSESSDPEQPDEEQSSAERRAVSVDEAESVQDEASAAVRESARQALEEAAEAVESEAADGTNGAGDEQEPPEDGVPFGSPMDSQLAPGGAGSPFEQQKETAEQEVLDEEIPEEFDDVERVSTNGEVVRAEYDLSQDEEKDEAMSSPRRAPDEASTSSQTPPPEQAGGTERADGPDGESADDTDDEEFEQGLEWDDEPTARKIEPSTPSEPASEAGEREERETREPPSESSDSPSEQLEEPSSPEANSSSEEIEEASSSPTDEWPGATIDPPSDENADEADSPDASAERETEPATSEADESDSTKVGMKEKAMTTDEGFGEEVDLSEADESDSTQIGMKEKVTTTDEGFGEEVDLSEADETDSTQIGMKEKATTTDEGFGEEVDLSESDVPETKTGLSEADGPETQSEPSAETESQVDEASTEEATPVEAAEEEGSVGEVLSDSSSEQSFFEQDDQETEDEYDWDFDEDLEEPRSGGSWGYVAAAVGVAALLAGAGWGLELGPFGTSTNGSSGTETGGDEAVASSETPNDESTETTSDGDETETSEEMDETESVEPPESRGAGALETFAEASATSVAGQARETALVLSGKDPLAVAETSDEEGDEADDETSDEEASEADGERQPEQTAQADQQTGSSGSSEGGGSGLSDKIARARQLIGNQKYGEAQSLLDNLRQQAPNNGKVAKLYLDMASNLQIEDRTVEAKQAYRNYLDMKPSGSRADEVRSILNRL